MTDIATLGLAVDSSDIDKAGVALDGFTQKGARAEQQTRKALTATQEYTQSIDQAQAKVGLYGEAFDELANDILKLIKSTDPLAYSIANTQAEMQTANALFVAGALDIDTYEKSMSVLQSRVDGFTAKQDLLNSQFDKTNSVGGLSVSQLDAMNKQFASLGINVATSGGSISSFTQLIGIATQNGLTATQTFKAMGVALWTAIAPLLPIILAVGAAVGVVAGVWAIATKEMNKNIGDTTKELGLTQEQLDRLEKKGVDTSITMGDSFKGFFLTVKDKFYEAFGPQIDKVTEKFNEAYEWVKDATITVVKGFVGGWSGGIAGLIAGVNALPAAFKDAGALAANFFLDAIEQMVNKAITKLNSLTSFFNDIGGIAGIGKIGQIDTVSIGRVATTGAASNFGGVISSAASEGYDAGSASVDAFISAWEDNTKKVNQDRILGEAGDPNKASGGKGSGGKSDAEKEYEKLTEAAQDFIKDLKLETSEIGKNRIELKMMAAERAAALAPTKALKDEIKKVSEEWLASTNAFETETLRKGLEDINEEIAFESSLISLNAKERAIAIALREIDLTVKDKEREGITINTDLLAKETAEILKNAEARGELTMITDQANAAADEMAYLSDNIRDATDSFGELFGSAGEGFAQLTDILLDYNQTQLDGEAEIAEAREKYGANSVEARMAEMNAARELGAAETRMYGDALSAAKMFFNEKSAGFRLIQGIERAYRLFQFAMAVKDMILTKASMATDAAKTASSVANSGTRATADGIAAFAKTLASLPFPFNIAAGAAVLALLVGMGVKMGGKGGGGAASAASSGSSSSSDAGLSSAFESPYSTLPGAGGLYDPRNANSSNVTPASANDNFASGSTGTVIRFTDARTINAEGADAGTVQQIKQMLDQTQQETVNLAREAVSEDIAEASNRQNIGG